MIMEYKVHNDMVLDYKQRVWIVLWQHPVATSRKFSRKFKFRQTCPTLPPPPHYKLKLKHVKSQKSGWDTKVEKKICVGPQKGVIQNYRYSVITSDVSQ